MDNLRENKAARTAAILLVAVLITLCILAGTLAKYITKDNASDYARVAKFGLTATVSGNLFGQAYSHDAETTDKSAIVKYSTGNKDCTIKTSQSGTKILAPGAHNDKGLTIAVKGTPEVATKVKLGGSKVPDTDICLRYGEYVIVSKINPETVAPEIVESPYYKDACISAFYGEGDLETAIQKANYFEFDSGNNTLKNCYSTRPDDADPFGLTFEQARAKYQYLIQQEVYVNDDEYYPITWQVNGTGDYKRIEQVKGALNVSLNAQHAPNYNYDNPTGEAGKTGGNTNTVTWSWDFDDGKGTNDNKDTILGQMIAQALTGDDSYKIAVKQPAENIEETFWYRSKKENWDKLPQEEKEKYSKGYIEWLYWASKLDSKLDENYYVVKYEEIPVVKGSTEKVWVAYYGDTPPSFLYESDELLYNPPGELYVLPDADKKAVLATNNIVAVLSENFSTQLTAKQISSSVHTDLPGKIFYVTNEAKDNYKFYKENGEEIKDWGTNGSNLSEATQYDKLGDTTADAVYMLGYDVEGRIFTSKNKLCSGGGSLINEGEDGFGSVTTNLDFGAGKTNTQYLVKAEGNNTDRLKFGQNYVKTVLKEALQVPGQENYYLPSVYEAFKAAPMLESSLYSTLKLPQIYTSNMSNLMKASLAGNNDRYYIIQNKCQVDGIQDPKEGDIGVKGQLTPTDWIGMQDYKSAPRMHLITSM